MSQLTPEQHTAVQEWAAAGATLNDVQRRLKEEFSVTITYLDARLLLMDLQIKIQDKPKEKELVPHEPDVSPSGPYPGDQDGADVDGDGMYSEEEPLGPPGASGLKIDTDQLAIPGAIISGKVTFSDGQSAGWYLDQMGRLGLRNVEPGYKPPAADVPLFQQELDRILSQAGF